MSSLPKSVYVVVPAFNEQSVIRNVVMELLESRYNVIVVDDGSGRSQAGFLLNLPVFYLRHPVNLGQGAALQTGIEFALEQGAAYVVTFDADAQHCAADIQQMLLWMKESGADVVLGSRFLSSERQQLPFSRKLVLHFARMINLFFTGMYLTDAHNGLRLLNRKAAGKIVLVENRMAHATEILLQLKKHRLNFVEAPVNIAYSAYSLQKGQTTWSGFRILIDLLLSKLIQ